jgi:hypothetical protein
VEHLGHVAEDDERANGGFARRLGRDHRHLEVAPLARFRVKRARVAKARERRVLFVRAERAITAAEPDREDVVAVAADDVAVVVPGDALRGAVEEVDAPVEIVREHAVGEVVEQRPERQADLADRLEEPVLEQRLDAPADVVADLAVQRVCLHVGGRLVLRRIDERPVEARGRARKGRADLAGVVAERDHDVEGLGGHFAERVGGARPYLVAGLAHHPKRGGSKILTHVARVFDPHLARRDAVGEGRRHLAPPGVPGADEENSQHGLARPSPKL